MAIPSRERTRNYRESHREQIKAANREAGARQRSRAASQRYRARSLGKFRIYQTSAEVRSLLFSLLYSDFIGLIKSECSYCGASPSGGIDRRQSDRGYTLENCVACCSQCNYMKLDYSEDEFLAQIERIYQRRHRG